MADDATRYICLLRGKMQERIKSGPGEIFRAFREFRRAARSADNQITEIEFIQCLKHVGIIKKKGENALARRVFRAIDTSKNGRIDFNEFVTNVIGSTVEDFTRLPSRENNEDAKRKKHLRSSSKIKRDSSYRVPPFDPIRQKEELEHIYLVVVRNLFWVPQTWQLDRLHTNYLENQSDLK